MDDDGNNDVFIEPPDVHDFTDEDSGDENLDGAHSADKLSRGQLLAPAELRSRGTKLPDDLSDDSSEEECQPSMKKRKPSGYTWKEDAMPRGCNIFPQGNYSKYSNLSPAELFELFIDEDILHLMKEEILKYSIKRSWPDIKVEVSELKVFLAVLLLTGYNTLPRKPMYWSKSADCLNEAVSNAMRRDRFDIIMKYLHFNSCDLDAGDKYTKIRPLIKHLQVKCMEHFVPTKDISHDEAMIEYFGKHGCKQAIRNKPIRFGYKVWCQNTDIGYLCAFDIYQGKTFKGIEELEKKFGKCAGTVLHLLSSYSNEKKDLPYHLFFDNLFTTLPLLHELQNRGYDGTGTLRANRLDKSCPLKSQSSIDKSGRGCFHSVTGVMDDTQVNVTRWKDNAVVTAASTLLRENPVGEVRRWSKADKKHIQVKIPHVINIYNQHMGGTDRMDQNINAYRIAIRGKKWWWPLFTWLVDVSVQNAWILSRGAGKQLDLLEFRREIVMSYLLRYRNLPKTAGRKPVSKPGENDARFDYMGHFIKPTDNNERRRCAGEICTARVRTECCKCNVGLCFQCFIKYHTRT